MSRGSRRAARRHRMSWSRAANVLLPRGQPSQCSETGSAVLGFGKNAAGKLGDLGGCQSEAIKRAFADYTLYPLPDSITDEQAVFLADILPTGFFGALNGDIRPAIPSRSMDAVRWDYAR